MNKKPLKFSGFFYIYIMKYIKSFEKFTPMIGIGSRPELSGELVEDDGEAIAPTSIEITGKAGQPTRKVRVQKIGKKPGAKLKVSEPNYIPGIQMRNNNDGTELNSHPSQS